MRYALRYVVPFCALAHAALILMHHMDGSPPSIANTLVMFAIAAWSIIIVAQE